MGFSLLAARWRAGPLLIFCRLMERIFWHAGERRKAAAEVSQNPADRARAAGGRNGTEGTIDVAVRRAGS